MGDGAAPPATVPNTPAGGGDTSNATQVYTDFQEALGIWKLFVSMGQSRHQSMFDAAGGSKDTTKVFRIQG